MNPPDWAKLDSDDALADAIAYYAERASRVNPNAPARRDLRKLLTLYDLRVADMLTRLRQPPLFEVRR